MFICFACANLLRLVLGSLDYCLNCVINLCSYNVHHETYRATNKRNTVEWITWWLKFSRFAQNSNPPLISATKTHKNDTSVMMLVRANHTGTRTAAIQASQLCARWEDCIICGKLCARTPVVCVFAHQHPNGRQRPACHVCKTTDRKRQTNRQPAMSIKLTLRAITAAALLWHSSLATQESPNSGDGALMHNSAAHLEHSAGNPSHVLFKDHV